ncbi:hypothetical protein BJX96DRAFT_186274 [Aspergillus floccosus]
MQFSTIITLLGFAAIGLAQAEGPYDSPCGSYRTCLEICPEADFFPLIDQCDIGDLGEPECYAPIADIFLNIQYLWKKHGNQNRRHLRRKSSPSTLDTTLTPQASGNFGAPITAALQQAGFNITIITRTESTSTYPPGIPVIRTSYTLDDLIPALQGQDAVVCVVGPRGIGAQSTMVDAAEAVGVKRFIINDFGWGPDFQGMPEFGEIHAHRRAGWDRAAAKAEQNKGFTWTGITSGNPIDWAMKKFPLMGFDISTRSAVIYDDGTEQFTGTTLAGIGQAVVGVLQHPEDTANRFVKVRSIKTCQRALLDAFQSVTGKEWDVRTATTQGLIKSGRRKHQDGVGGWILDLVVAQLFEPGKARCVVAASREESDADLLGMVEESPEDVVRKALKEDS